MHRFVVAVLLSFAALRGAVGDETAADRVMAEQIRAAGLRDGIRRLDVGVTADGTRIPSLVTDSDLIIVSSKTRVLFVEGLEGGLESGAASLAALRWYDRGEAAPEYRRRFAVSAIPFACPEGGTAAVGYPPAGDAYAGEDPERQYIWRWLGTSAPDLVVVLDRGAPAGITVPAAADELTRRLGPAYEPQPGQDGRDLASALVAFPPANVGTIPAIRIGGAFTPENLRELLDTLDRVGFSGPSPARRELQRRIDRSPVEVAEQLAKHYGHELGSVAYIPAVALIGRVRLGELTADPSHEADVRRIVAPYLGGKATLGEKPTGANVAGHLVFTELDERAGKERDDRLLAIVRQAVEQSYDAHAAIPLTSHSEMSDAVFMGGPLLAHYGALTGEKRWFDLCAKHVRAMTDLNLREDGLHRHSPLDETAWGRGNGFPALALALILENFPEDHPERAYLLKVYRDHMAALARHQDATGMWHQVVDHPGSYRELSCTCMITYAMLRGLRRGWLERETFEPTVERSWPAIKSRVASDGTLVDVCTGTGKQRSLRDYLDRTAILGKDARGGAMALLVATEMAAYDRRMR